jgi:hypothetical protein
MSGFVKNIVNTSISFFTKGKVCRFGGMSLLNIDGTTALFDVGW